MPAGLDALVMLAFWGGLRLGELLGLQHGDVSLDVEALTGTVEIERQHQDIDRELVTGPPKAGSVRTVNLDGAVVTKLAEHVTRSGPVLPSASLFVRASGLPLRK